MADIRVVGKVIATPPLLPPIYRLKKPVVNQRALLTLARRLGLKAEGGVHRSDEHTLRYSEGHLELTMYRLSGGVRFLDRARWQVDDRKADLKIEDQAAFQLAQKYSRKYKLAPPAETRFLKAARLRVGAMNREGSQSYERTIDVAVALQRLVGKVPVDGPGGKVVVYLDHNGKTTGFEQIWRPLGGVYRKAESVRSPQVAIEEMDRQFRDKKGIIEVREVRFGYFEAGWRSAQEHLQPAYVITGVVTTGSERVHRKMVYVTTALSNPVGRLTPPLVRKRPQTARPHAG